MQGSSAPKRPLSAFLLFCSGAAPKIGGEHPGLSRGDAERKLGEMGGRPGAGDRRPEKGRLLDRRTQRLLLVLSWVPPKGVAKAEENPEKEEEDGEGDENLVLVQLFLAYKALNPLHAPRFF